MNPEHAMAPSEGSRFAEAPFPVIEWSAVTLAHPGGTVVRDASFAIEPRETVAFVGCSGSGKSTLLKACAGLMQPTAGTVRLFGHNLSDLTHHELLSLRRDRVGFVFQKSALLSNLRVRDNLALPLRYHTDYPEERIRAAVEERLDVVGARAYADLFPAQLPYTAQKLVGIARALMLAPDLLLFDDPTAFLDDAAERMVVELLQKLRRSPVTIVVATDSIAVVHALATRVYALHGGALTRCTDVREAERLVCIRPVVRDGG